MFEVRPAVPSDRDQIITILAQSFPARICPYTIVGSSKFGVYLKDSLDAPKSDGGPHYLVASHEGGVLGFVELRGGSDSLFLNHIYVHPSARERGVGRALVREGIHLLSATLSGSIDLDVLSDNKHARAWYQRLGFRPLYWQTWRRLALARAQSSTAGCCRALGIAEAEQIHAAYGFSQFTLETPRGVYAIGRLGRALFRITNAELLENQAALSALHAIDPARDLLCIAPNTPAAHASNEESTIVAESIRMSAPVKHVLSALGTGKFDSSTSS